MPMAKLRLQVPEEVWVGELSRAHPEATFRVLAALADEGSGVALVEISAPDARAVARALETYRPVTGVELLKLDDDDALVQLETTRPVVLSPMQASGVPLEFPVDIVDGEAVVELTAPRDRLSTLGRQLEEFGIDYTVEWIRGDVEPDQLLTDRQAELLRAAADLGYYDTPRDCTLTELAAAVDIAKSTCSETLHRAESKVISQYLATESEPEEPLAAEPAEPT